MPPFVTVAAYAPHGVGMLGAGIVSEVFDTRGGGLPLFDFALCTDRPGKVRTDVGLPLVVEHGLDRLASADLVIALPWAEFRTPPGPAVLDALTAAHARGALVAAHCVGAFALAAAGLLDGRRATTHWRFARLLAERHPDVTVEPDALYIDEGPVVTGAAPQPASTSACTSCAGSTGPPRPTPSPGTWCSPPTATAARPSTSRRPYPRTAGTNGSPMSSPGPGSTSTSPFP